MDRIEDFRGAFRWLSNFEACTVVFEGETYASSEHAYQAAKTKDPSWRRMVRDASTPGKAKRLGNGLPLRPDWERIKLDVMRTILRDKFTRNPHLREKLLATGDAELVEGNTWGDRFWGVCQGVGENHLGKLLMELRAQLREGRVL